MYVLRFNLFFKNFLDIVNYEICDIKVIKKRLKDKEFKIRLYFL